MGCGCKSGKKPSTNIVVKPKAGAKKINTNRTNKRK